MWIPAPSVPFFIGRCKISIADWQEKKCMAKRILHVGETVSSYHPSRLEPVSAQIGRNPAYHYQQTEIENYVNQAFLDVMGITADRFTGEQLIKRDVLVTFVKYQLKQDLSMLAKMASMSTSQNRPSKVP